MGQHNDGSHSYMISTWEPEIAQKIQRSLKNRSSDSSQPYMVCLVGIPGGGKSVSSQLLVNLLEQDDGGNEEEKTKTSVTIMPHDGYHIPLENLWQMPNAENAVYRRGAPDTFDPAALKRDLERIRFGNEDMITVPGFDHAQGDPEPDQHVFDRRRHNVVICEGLVRKIYVGECKGSRL
jgi:pantothenate kinase